MSTLTEASGSEQLTGLLNAAETPVVLYFTADWCRPCRITEPVIEELVREMKDEVVFLKIDVDKNEEIARSYEVKSIPCIILIENMETKGLLVGAVPKFKIQRLLKKAL